MDSAAHLLNFSTPTHTLDLYHHRNGYSHSKTALVRSVSGPPEIKFFHGLNSETVSELMRITIFNIVILLDRLGNLMICTHNLIVLNKTKEMTCYCESFEYGGKILLAHVSIILTQVSAPIKNRSNLPLGA
jgi:hypothetical protein